MGIEPIPDTSGNHCTICWPVPDTPDMLKVFFEGIERGDDWVPGDGQPPNGYYDYFQIPANPCQFNKPAPHPAGSVVFRPDGTDCTLSATPWVGAFWGLSNDNCVRYFTNRYHQAANHHFWNGYAFIATPQQMAAWIEMATPITGPDPRMGLYPMANGEIVLKFCNIQDGTNIKIKLDTALL